MNFSRITINPCQMNGMPYIRGLRIPAATIVAMVAEGMNDTKILAAYPDLDKGDIVESLRYAAEALRERELPHSEHCLRSVPRSNHLSFYSEA